MEKNTLWRDRFQKVFQVCQNEIKRTAQIGKKMFYATKTNSNLHEAYEELGQLVAKELKAGKLRWNNTRVRELVDIIESFEENLAHMENEVGQIKSSPMENSLSSPAPQVKNISRSSTKDN